MNRLAPLSRKTPLKQRKPLSRGRMRRKPKPPIPAAVQRYWDSLPTRCIVPGCTAGAIRHHILADAPGKVRHRDDMLIVKLCHDHHNLGNVSVHLLGSERAFLAATGVDLVAIAVCNRDAWEAKHG